MGLTLSIGGLMEPYKAFNSINELSYSDVISHAISDDVVLLGLRMRWDIRFGDDVTNMDGSAFAWAGQAMGGDNHVLATLKQVGDELKFCSWVEAPDAPLLYVAELYRRNVRSDFPAS